MHQNSAAYFLTNFEDISSFWSTTVHSFWLFFEQFFAILKHFVTGFRSFFNQFRLQIHTLLQVFAHFLTNF